MGKLVLPPAVDACCRTLRQAGYLSYPVGGCVRDLLLGRVPDDWDVATLALPQQIQAAFPHTVPTGIAHGTVTVLLEGSAIEVTSFRGESAYSDGRHPDEVTFGVDSFADLARRDFTINAMALEADGGVLDPFGGQRDLAAKLVRCVGNPAQRFREDALRLLRCLRFSAQLGFAVEEKTMAALVENAALVGCVSAERVVGEVEKTLLSPRPELALEMARLGLLEPYLPTGTVADCAALSGAPATAEGRWRAFCAATKLDITALPVSRGLRRAVLYRPESDPNTLAVTGRELYGLGLRGSEISAAQRKLLGYVAQHPSENQKERLLALLEKD